MSNQSLLSSCPPFSTILKRIAYFIRSDLVFNEPSDLFLDYHLQAISPDENLDSSLTIGLMTGALTSTPGFSAAREVAANPNKVSAGYGIAYLFGVIGVVLFVQIMPKILKVDIAKEREKYIAANTVEIKPITKNLIKVDNYGFFSFALTIILGCAIGCIEIPEINFSLGTSGGVLVAGLLIGHFQHIGPFDCQIKMIR